MKPGQNEAMLQPVTIEKPRYDGFITRVKPDIARSLDGSKPNTENLHLHHATWLNLGNSYGDGPFFAAGEEKTIANFPTGYGMQTKGSDQWGLLYMVHNGIQAPDSLYITYEIDFVPTAAAQELGIVPVKPLWLDVQKRSIYNGPEGEAPSTGSNPVFNVQKGYGSVDPDTGRRVCRWPDQNCARFDVYGEVTPQQGVDVSDKLKGADYRVPASMAGTLVGLGGHLHPGGIAIDVTQERGGVEKPIFTSDALYWEYAGGAINKAAAAPHSWNMSMTVTGAPLDWKVNIKEGDVIRLNAIYDSDQASWYENMGIVVAYVAPNDPHGKPGLDVFDDVVEITDGVPTKALSPEGAWHKGANGAPDFTPPPCTPDLEGTDGVKNLCLRGQVTHWAVPESLNGTDAPCAGGQHSCPPLPEQDGPELNEIRSVGFTYGEADLAVIGTTGVPRVKKGEAVRLWNYDTAARIWHTFTRCKEPCTGPTKINYPIADGGSGSADDLMDFESMEIGYGLFWEPAKSQIGGSKSYNDQWVKDGLYWDFTPSETGTYSFFCRIHPGMRGAFKVVE